MIHLGDPMINHMTSIKENNLYLQLKEAYTEVNLNRITRNLIRLYNEKQYDMLGRIVELIAEWVTINMREVRQGFSKLIMLYHPDRAQYYQTALENSLASDNSEQLKHLEHILVIQDIEEISVIPGDYEDIDYTPEYAWDNDISGFSYFSAPEPSQHTVRKNRVTKKNYTFYDAVRIRNYGNTTTRIATCYFGEWDEIELAESDIFDLDGIEYCVNAVTLDLSGNSITDISPLFGLASIEELNLSNNKIGYIDALSNLLNLRNVDLSNNRIDDVSPLFNLPRLEYCDLTGNKIPVSQILELEELGITVSYK